MDCYPFSQYNPCQPALELDSTTVYSEFKPSQDSPQAPYCHPSRAQPPHYQRPPLKSTFVTVSEPWTRPQHPGLTLGAVHSVGLAICMMALHPLLQGTSSALKSSTLCLLTSTPSNPWQPRIFLLTPYFCLFQNVT